MDEERNGGTGTGGNSAWDAGTGEGTASLSAGGASGSEHGASGEGSSGPGPANMDTSHERSNDWRSALPEGWAGRLRDVKDADEAMKALERGLSYRPAERPEDIALTFPESFKGAVDAGVQQNFREFCVREGITPGQAQALLDWQIGTDRELRDRIIEDGTRALRAAWGSRFQEKRETALKAFSALDRRMGGELSGSLAGRGMADDPAFVRAFYEIGRLISEDRLSSGVPAGAGDMRESAEETYNGMFKGE